MIGFGQEVVVEKAEEEREGQSYREGNAHHRFERKPTCLECKYLVILCGSTKAHDYCHEDRHWSAVRQYQGQRINEDLSDDTDRQTFSDKEIYQAEQFVH